MAEQGVPRRVLVIDDEPDIRELVKAGIEYSTGWTVFVAGSGKEGITMAGSTQPDVILLDVMMPDMDGFSTVEQLRASDSTRNIPILLLTAKVQAADCERFKQWPVSGVLAKPFNPTALAKEISTLLGWDS